MVPTSTGAEYILAFMLADARHWQTRTCTHWKRTKRNRTRDLIHAILYKITGGDVRNRRKKKNTNEGRTRRETKRGEREIKKKGGGTRCHSEVRNGRREETFERGKKPYASAAAIGRRRIAMLRSLALSLAASTAAQFLHANQPTDPPSTHHLTLPLPRPHPQPSPYRYPSRRQ